MPAHEVEINLVLLVLPQQHVPKHLNFRNVFDSLVHQAPDELYICFLDFIFRKVPSNEVGLLFRLVDFIAADVTVAEL